jgi:hypothetical protein
MDMCESGLEEVTFGCKERESVDAEVTRRDKLWIPPLAAPMRTLTANIARADAEGKALG